MFEDRRGITELVTDKSRVVMYFEIVESDIVRPILFLKNRITRIDEIELSRRELRGLLELFTGTKESFSFANYKFEIADSELIVFYYKYPWQKETETKVFKFDLFADFRKDLISWCKSFLSSTNKDLLNRSKDKL
jgi:hypothetical protein